jgi:hypothetical protein
MFNKIAKLDAGRRRAVPAPVHHNDNRPDRRLAAVSPRPVRPTCRWRAGADGRLECHWQIEPSDQTSAEVPRPRFKTCRPPGAAWGRQIVFPAGAAVRRGFADGRTT